MDYVGDLRCLLDLVVGVVDHLALEEEFPSELIVELDDPVETGVHLLVIGIELTVGLLFLKIDLVVIRVVVIVSDQSCVNVNLRFLRSFMVMG